MGYQSGSTVNTTFGVGVIVQIREHDFVVRLWRMPGQSIGSSATAYLRPVQILGTLPVAPGVLTNLKDERNSRVLVQCYLPNRGIYLVSGVEKEVELSESMRQRSTRFGNFLQQPNYFQVEPENLEVSKASKFYPVLESLMVRAEQAASATRGILSNDKTKEIVNQTGKLIQEKAGQVNEMLQTENPADIDMSTPVVQKNVKRVMEMVKDDELNVLFQKAKDRLEALTKNDIPKTTQQALQKTGIVIDIQESNLNRKAALEALRSLLDKNGIPGDFDAQFSVAFDKLSEVAKSDRGLNELFEGINEKTALWQEETGRLMNTKSAGLFLEGASRIQARAAAIFGRSIQFEEIGNTFTKSFTEGDAALAKLKSIELGEAVRGRLVEAIEIRSESSGGLDGIIAGALSSMKNSNGTRIQDMLTTLQQTASSKTADAHETLISVLSSKSTYRDQALLRLEQALCDLDSQIDFDADEIAKLVRGEGGTANLFEPIAKRAMQQIEKQLDAAQIQVGDPTVTEVLARIRKIMSGELTLSAVMDEIVDVLNDDKVVKAGETIVQQSEYVLDALEGVSANQAVNNAIQMVEKAGITKDSVMKEFEKLNVEDLLGAAGDAVTDEKARRKMLSSATDTALDFVLRILPSMPVPPFEGVKDGLVYHISNLSMKGFKVRKENIQIELAGMRATKRRRRRARSLSHDTYENGDRVQLQSFSSFESVSSIGSIDIDDSKPSSVRATELLIIEISGISAVLDNARWSFEQTYLPYLKGSGSANIRMYGGSIRLQFELRKKRTESDGETGWEPVLCLHDRSCEINDVDLSLDGEGKITWVLNKLAAIFKGPLRDYVVHTIVNVLSSKSGWILERLNGILAPYWDLILRTANLDMETLVEADDDVILMEPAKDTHKIVELVWRERLPLGMNLLMNDDSGMIKVVDFPRGSQARIVCEKRGFEPAAFEGASIVAVNGSMYADQDDIFDALKEPGRPKTVGFVLAESEEANQLREYLADFEEPIPEIKDVPRKFSFRSVEFTSIGDLGIEFCVSADNASLAVKGFIEGDAGTVLAAERSNQVNVGDILTHINNEPVLQADGDGQARAIQLLESAVTVRPVVLSFIDPYMHSVRIEKPVDYPTVDTNCGPSELLLSECLIDGKKRIAIRGFKDVSGAAESTGILIGDHLAFVNGVPVGAGCRWMHIPSAPTMEEAMDMLKQGENYPMGLTFARPKQETKSRWSVGSPRELSDSDAETICVAADSQERLGCRFENSGRSDIIVSDFVAVPGVFQRALTRCKDPNGSINVSVESINGQYVPSYATIDLVKNAVNRGWNTDGTIDLLLCDDELKTWIFDNLQEGITPIAGGSN